MIDLHIELASGHGLLAGGENAYLAKRPYVANEGPNRGRPVIAFNTGRRDKDGKPIYAEKAIQGNATTLRKDEWINLEDAILTAAEERLVIVDDLRSAGMTYNVGGLGVQIAEWETVDQMTEASATMDGDTVGEKDRVGYGLDGVPIPIIHKDFQISERALLASRTRGSDLSVDNAYAAGRVVAEKSEDMIFNGLNIGGVPGSSYRVYGLLNKPNRPVQLISDWSAGGTSAETVLSEINSMISELETEQRVFGGLTLYIPTAYAAKFRADFKANSDKTLRQRVLEIPEIVDVKVADRLTAGNVVLIQMNRRTMDLAIAADLTTVNWQSGSGFTNFFKTYAAWAPRIKVDANGRFGYIHGATST